MITNTLKLTFFIAAIGITSCNNSPQDKSQKLDEAQINLTEAEQDLKEARLDSANEFLTYKENAEAKIKENDRKITLIKEKMKDENPEAREKHEKQLTELELKNTNLKNRIQEYKEEGVDKWKSFKQDFNRDLDDLGKSISEMAENNMNKN